MQHHRPPPHLEQLQLAARVADRQLVPLAAVGAAVIQGHRHALCWVCAWLQRGGGGRGGGAARGRLAPKRQLSHGAVSQRGSQPGHGRPWVPAQVKDAGQRERRQRF